MFMWKDSKFKTLSAALQAVAADPTKKEALIYGRGADYIYTPDSGELWRLGKKGPQRMQDRKYRMEAERVFVLAGSHAQARDYCRFNDIDPRRLAYVVDGRSLLGVSPGQLVVYGTPRRRRDYWEILDRARAVGWEIVQGTDNGR